MNETKLSAEKRMELLINMLNMKIDFPVYMEKKVKGKVEEVISKSVSLTPFNDNEIATLKALLFMDVNDHIDCGRIEAAKQQRIKTLQAENETLLTAKKDEEVNNG